MKLLRNLFTFIGFSITILFVVAFIKFDLGTKFKQASQLDPQAMGLYMNMADVVLNTGNAAEGMIRKVKIDSDVSNEDVLEALNALAIERGIKPVGDLPLSAEVEARTGKKQRYVRVLSYCNPNIAMKMVDFSKAYGAFLPCRIVIMEDKNGDRWMYTMALELMISGGKTLPKDMLEYGNKVRKTIYDMMDLAAKGDF